MTADRTVTELLRITRTTDQPVSNVHITIEKLPVDVGNALACQEQQEIFRLFGLFERHLLSVVAGRHACPLFECAEKGTGFIKTQLLGNNTVGQILTA